MTGTCICGACIVTIEEQPEFIHDCDCNLCRKTGAAWGYFTSTSVSIEPDSTLSFVRNDKENPTAVVHSCEVCGATTHFTPSESYLEQNPAADQMGVNMKLFDPAELTGVEVRFPDGKNWPGEGSFGYRREAMTISDSLPW